MKHIYAGLIVPLSAIAPVSAGIFKKLYRKAPAALILCYLIFALVTDVAERLIGQRHINNLPLLHFYTLVEGVLILAYFRSVINTAGQKRLTGVFLILFAAFTLIDLCFLNSIFEFNSYSRLLGAILILICCFMYLHNTVSEERWKGNPYTWITAGILLYFGSSLVYFGLLNFIVANTTYATWYLIQDIHATFVLCMYILITVGFLNKTLKLER